MEIEKNDIGWFKETFDQNYNLILNYLFYLSGNSELAEDLAQDVFMQLWEKRKEVKNETLRPFLYIIARNNFLKNIRHHKYDMKFRSTYLEKIEKESPEFLLEMKEFDQHLQEVIAGLPEKCRVVFLMNRLDENTYREIAENLGVTVKAVEKQMSKALAILREKLGEKI